MILREAVDQLTGRCAVGIRECDAIECYILAMADTPSSGIVRQFPGRFRGATRDIGSGV